MAKPAELDHVPFGAADLQTAGRALSRLGFALSDVGVCRWSLAGRDGSARSLCVVFPRGYLDLIEIDGPGWREHVASSPVYGEGLAPTGVVLTCPRPDAERSRLVEAGVAVHPPYDIERTLAAASPTPLRYRIASLDHRAACLPLALLRDDSPEAMRMPSWLAHPNGALSIARLVLRVPSVERAFEEAAATLPGARRSDSTLDLGNASATLVESPQDAWTASIFDALGRPERTSLLALEFTTSDIECAARSLEEGGVAFARCGDRLLVAPAEGVGCGFAFAPAEARFASAPAGGRNP